MTDISVLQLAIGPMDNFAYFIISKAQKEVLIVDPGWEADTLLKKLIELSLTPIGILLTHGHYDHVNAIPEIQADYPQLPVYFSKNELAMFAPKCNNIVDIEGGTVLNLLGITIQCIATPGHSPGGICFQLTDYLFTGDTLFIQGCGRCDLPGSNPKEMYNSLYTRLKPLPGHLVVYAGHNYGHVPSTTLSEVIASNPILNCETPAQFLGRFF